MIVTLDPTAREFLNAQRDCLGDLYTDWLWASRAFETEAKNRRAIATWRTWFATTGKVWNRFHGAERFKIVETKTAQVVSLRRVP